MNSFQTGQLPNGHCWIWASNCAWNFDENASAVQSVPVFGWALTHLDPFYNDFRDLVYTGEGEACRVNLGSDLFSTALVFVPGPKANGIAEDVFRYTGNLPAALWTLKNNWWFGQIAKSGISHAVAAGIGGSAGGCGCGT